MSNDKEPVIKQALGESWEGLAETVKQHYDITPGESSKMTIIGTMDEVYHSNIAKLFLLPGRIFGALVPYKGKNIPTEVRNWTSENNHKAMFWYRTLNFPNKPPLIFSSRMEYTNDDEIIEYVRYGLGIRMKMSVDNGALVFKSKSYVWTIGAISVPIPTWLILGDAVITEKAISEDEFYMDFYMIHPLFGKTFSYSGTFSIAGK